MDEILRAELNDIAEGRTTDASEIRDTLRHAREVSSKSMRATMSLSTPFFSRRNFSVAGPMRA